MPVTKEVWRRDRQTDRNAMSLPLGKTCSDCKHYDYCQKLFGCNPSNEVCDWAPSRFHEIKP